MVGPRWGRRVGRSVPRLSGRGLAGGEQGPPPGAEPGPRWASPPPIPASNGGALHPGWTIARSVLLPAAPGHPAARAACESSHQTAFSAARLESPGQLRDARAWRSRSAWSLGLFGGQWLDKKLHTGGVLTWSRLRLRACGRGRAIYRAVRKSNREAEEAERREREARQKYDDDGSDDEDDHGLRAALWAVAITRCLAHARLAVRARPQRHRRRRAGLGIAALNLWALGRIVRAFMNGAGLPWVLLGAFQLVGLLALARGGAQLGLTTVIPLAIGYGALPVGIVFAQLGAVARAPPRAPNVKGESTMIPAPKVDRCPNILPGLR